MEMSEVKKKKKVNFIASMSKSRRFRQITILESVHVIGEVNFINRAPPPPGKVLKTNEPQNGKENLPKQGKKKAPTPKPVIARQLSDKNQAVKLPGPAGKKFSN